MTRSKPKACDPAAQAAKIATFRARAERIGEMVAELAILRALRVADMWEMRDDMGMSNHAIAEVTRVTQPYVTQVFNAGRPKRKRRMSGGRKQTAKKVLE